MGILQIGRERGERFSQIDERREDGGKEGVINDYRTLLGFFTLATIIAHPLFHRLLPN